MTDYQYDDEHVQLTDNKADNGAQSLEGYELDIRPEANWPGLKSPKGGGFYFDTDAAQDISAWLAQQVPTIQRAAALTKTAAGASFGPHSWLEAKNLAEASAAVAETVARYAEKLASSVDTASDSISNAAATVSGADHSAGKGAQNVDSTIQSDGAPTQSTAPSLGN